MSCHCRKMWLAAASDRCYNRPMAVDDSSVPGRHPLLAPFTQPQQAVFDVLAEVWLNGGERYPVYDYVEREIDKRGYALEEVLPTFPAIRARAPGPLATVYQAVWSYRLGGGRDSPIGLTIAGLAHLPRENQKVVREFLTVLRWMARVRLEATSDPFTVSEVSVKSSDLSRAMRRGGRRLARMRMLFAHEPSIWGGGNADQGEADWTWSCPRQLRYFVDVRDVNDYLHRMTAFIEPDSDEDADAVTLPRDDPPLGFAAALDSFDTLWRLKYGKRLVVLPSAFSVASLEYEARTPEDFDARLSSLGQILKGFDIPAGRGASGHPVMRLHAAMQRDLPVEAHQRVAGAVATLEAAVFVRNARQHAPAAPQAVAALKVLGTTYPITDWSSTWSLIQRQVTLALWDLREELQASLDGDA